MATKIAINGFGRIGRLALRAVIESGRRDIDVVAINDLGSAKFNAHLLQYDSVHGTLSKKVSSRKSSIRIGNKSIKIFAEKNPEDLPWSDLGIDIAKRVETLSVELPPERDAGIKVESVSDLVDKLKNEEKVIWEFL